MRFVIGKNLLLQDIPQNLRSILTALLTLENPAWLDNDRMGRWQDDTPQFLRLYRSTGSALVVPRGYLGHVIGLCKQHGVRFIVDDQRRTLAPVEFHFTGQLRDFQQEAIEAMPKRDFGTLSAPTGSGKTVMALALVAERKQPTLIVVNTRELLNQWVERIEQFLGIPRKDIGVIGNGTREIGEKITVAMVQTLVKNPESVAPFIGHLIVDECHHCPSKTFTDVVTTFDSRYMLGLSATPWRRDGLSRLIFWYVGDMVHQIEKAGLVETDNVLSFEVTTVETNFQSTFDPSEQYASMLSELTKDEERNRLIADTVVKNHNASVSLVLTDRKAHCTDLQELSKERGVKAAVLTGDCTPRERENIVASLNQGTTKTVIATGQLVGEGLDCPALSNLFICTPIKFDGRLIQYLGRVLRPAPEKKKARVIDFVDAKIVVLKAAAKSRAQVYAPSARAE